MIPIPGYSRYGYDKGKVLDSVVAQIGRAIGDNGAEWSQVRVLPTEPFIVGV